MPVIENQNTQVDSGFNPISKFNPNRVLATSPRGYAVTTSVSMADLENFKEIIDQAGAAITFTDDSFDI